LWSNISGEAVFDAAVKCRLIAAMPSICKGVDFDTIAREWRCKWSEDNDKKSLETLQQTLMEFMPKVRAVKAVGDVRRVVCGGCHDFKIVMSVPAEKFGAWEESKFAPEEEFLEAIKQIPGVSSVETQTYTISQVKYKPPPKLKKARTFNIGKLNPNSKGFTIEGKVLGAPTEVEGGKGKFFEVSVGDASGKVTCSLREDQVGAIKGAKTAIFRNAQVRMIKSQIRVIVDKWGKVDASEAEIETVGDKDVSAQEYELVAS